MMRGMRRCIEERLGDGISNRWDDDEGDERGGHMCDVRGERDEKNEGGGGYLEEGEDVNEGCT